MRRLRASGNRASLVAIALAAIVLSAGCGSGDDDSGSVDQTLPADEPAAPAGPVPGTGDTVQAGDSAAALVPSPAHAPPGDVVTVRVDNQGDTELGYGLANRVDRYVDGEWVEATAKVYEGGAPAFIEILVLLDPGQLGQIEEIPLDPEVEPGTYRVVKEVFAQGGTAPDVLTLEAVFQVDS